MSESAAYELIKKEGFDEGLQQGMQQGIEQGLRQGLVQSSRRLLLGALEARFDTVPRTVLSMLQAIDDPDILEMLHKAALRAESMEHFREKLRAVLES